MSTEWLAYNDLVHYDEKIKKYINDRYNLIKDDTYSKEDIDIKLEELENIKEKLNELTIYISTHEQKLIDLKDHIDENEAAILTLQAADQIITQSLGQLKVDIEVIKEASKDYATEEFVKDKIKEADIDLSEYAKKSDIPDTSKLVTIEQVDNIVSEEVILKLSSNTTLKYGSFGEI